MRRALLAMIICTLAMTACGDGEPDESSDGSGSSAAGPISIDHRYGTTTLAEPPKRIVSLDMQWTDVLVALDGPLVGAALDPQVEGGRYPWQDLPSSAEGIPVTDSIPFEAVAALTPDLIVITWAVTDEDEYDKLSEIAPTIPLLGDKEVDAWQDIATTAGKVLDEPERARQLVTEAATSATDTARSLPGLAGKTYALANYVPGDAIYVVADPDDGAATYFAQLGLSIDPDLVAMADGASGRTELSLERIDELDADLLILLTNGADPTEIIGYDALPAVRDGAVATLDLAAVTALNTPSPLSLPYSLDRIRPALEAAAT
jgi:iron complex transport system substrate-binding protein